MDKSDNESIISDTDEFKSVITESDAVPNTQISDDTASSPEQGSPEEEGSQDISDLATEKQNMLNLICQLETQNKIVENINCSVKIKSTKMPRSACDQYEIDCLTRKLNFEIQKFNQMASNYFQNHVKTAYPSQLSFFENCNNKTCPPPLEQSSTCSSINSIKKELSNSLCFQDKIVAENVELEEDRCKLQEELLYREKVIDTLQQKINILYSEFLSTKKMQCSSCKPGSKNIEAEQRLKCYKEKTCLLEKNLETMSMALKKLNLQLEYVQKDQQVSDGYEACGNQCAPKARPESPILICSPPTAQNGRELIQMKIQYETLLKEYGNKNSECQNLRENLERLCASLPTDKTEKVELDMMKRKCCELLEDQEQFKLLIQEQGEQLEDYRNKFLCAQTEVEQQKCKLDAYEANNLKIEEQINTEIHRIKCKFQEKIKELCPLPKRLEEEQKKLECCNQMRLETEEKLKGTCEEIDRLRIRCHKFEEDAMKKAACEKRMKEMAEEYDSMKYCIEKLSQEKNTLEHKLQELAKEQDCFRIESAKIIARNKECANSNKEALQCQINRLEIELAQCRANASLVLCEREECIKKMQKQLNVLSGSFDEAQCQVKTLKHNISLLKNG